MLLLVVSVFMSVGVFFALNTTGQNLIDIFLENSDYIENKNLEYAKKLRDHIDTYDLSTSDTIALYAWVKKQQIISVEIFKDGVHVFDSNYPNMDNNDDKTDISDYAWQNYFLIDFADGSAEVVITGAYIYQLYNYVTIGAIAASFIFFLIFVLLGIRKKMAYIRKLSKEIEILEGGSLDYEITVKGKDELAALAGGLENMRISFRNLINKEAEIIRENQHVVTEMSHDLRTPVTAIMLYTEILKRGKYKDRDQLEEYLDKIDAKACHMKLLTDHLFEYSLIAAKEKKELEPPEQMETLFYDLFTETCNYLEQKGFNVNFDVEWKPYLLRISTDYVMRILDNITSNIVKYADKKEPVKISFTENEKTVGFVFENHVGDPDINIESTGIGLQNIKNMMQQMGGSCEAAEENGNFSLKILFLYVRLNALG